MRARTMGAIGAVAGLLAAGAVASGGGPAGAEPAAPIRLNHVQVKGSHNSYHVEPPAETIDLYHSLAPQLEPHLLAYTHEPLDEQLDMGFRQFELDLFTDPTGLQFEPVGTPGFKVLHIDTIDEGSTCPLFTDCLQQIEDWSSANPTHVPIAVLVELKEGTVETTAPMDAAALHALDAEIRSVFDDDQLVTPDFVRGVGRPGGADGAGTVHPNVNEAILDTGWPVLDDVRGRVLFLLDNERNDYVDGDPTLAGRVAFPPSSPGLPDAAFLKMNDPEGANTASIQQRVAAGYLVRTRSDLPVTTGLSGDASQREAALVSGAHFVSGDYLTPTDFARYDQTFADRFGLPFDPARPPYQTVLPGGASFRCNPVTAPAGCEAVDIEPGRPAVLPTVLPGSGSALEGDAGTTTLEVPVTLSAPSSQAVTVEWTTLHVPDLDRDQATPGVDYTAASGTLTFAPGATTAAASVEVVGDTAVEPGELVVVSFHDPTNAAMGGFWGLGIGVIVGDDGWGPGPTVLPGSASVVEGDAGAVLQVPVWLTTPAAGAVTVEWATLPVDGLAEPQATAGADYTPASGTVTFAPGETAAAVSIPILDDAVLENEELLVVSFRNPTGAAMGGFWGLAIAAVIDDD